MDLNKLISTIDSNALGEVESPEEQDIKVIGTFHENDIKSEGRILYNQKENVTYYDNFDRMYNILCGWKGKYSLKEMMYFISLRYLQEEYLIVVK